MNRRCNSLGSSPTPLSPQPLHLPPHSTLPSASAPPPLPQVKHNYLPSPFNLLHYALFWLPSYDRPLVPGRISRALMMVSPDGEPIPDMPIMLRSGEVGRGGGGGEFPHMVVACPPAFSP